MANNRAEPEEASGRTGWIMQKGGFEALDDRQKASAERSYAAWTETNPDAASRHGLADYVSYVQEKQAERGSEPRTSRPAVAEPSKSFGEKVKDHLKKTALGPKGFASIVNELKYALADIRHKVVEEATYGRATTPHWRDTANTPQAGGIHGKTETPAQDAGGGVHGKTVAPAPGDDGGIHGKAVAPKPDAPAPDDGGVHGKAIEPVGHQATPAEPKGLGMSYAELSASWDKACEANHAGGREREPARQPEQAIER